MRSAGVLDCQYALSSGGSASDATVRVVRSIDIDCNTGFMIRPALFGNTRTELPP